MCTIPHKKRKIRKLRGSRTHGYGQIGQHRGGGQRGGKGRAGYLKHKWSYTIKYEPDRIRKHGFTPPQRREVNTINVGHLDEQIPLLLEQGRVKSTKEGILVPLNHLGYPKLLGRGSVTRPLIVQVESSSASAKEKIEVAGGRITDPSSEVIEGK